MKNTTHFFLKITEFTPLAKGSSYSTIPDIHIALI